MKKIIQHMLIGATIGSLVFMLYIIINGGMLVTVKIAISTLIMSIMIGLMSYLLIDINFSGLFAVILNWLATIIFVVCYTLYNHWLTSPFDAFSLLIQVTVIYIIIWCLFLWFKNKETKQLNQLIQKRKQK